jgi:hypothetical protein
MEQNPISHQIKIAIGLLGDSRTDRYGNGKVTHSHRNFIAQTITELWQNLLFSPDQRRTLIIPKNSNSINPPDESQNDETAGRGCRGSNYPSSLVGAF